VHKNAKKKNKGLLSKDIAFTTFYSFKDNQTTAHVFIIQCNFRRYLIAFWHRNCLTVNNQLNSPKMKELFKQYETAKKESIKFMKMGQINAYFDALIEMNYYKKLMIAVTSN